MATDESTPGRSSAAAQALLCVGALALLVGLMYYSLVYPYPNGKSLDLVGFVELWGRELLILGTAAIFLVVVLVAWLVGLVGRVLGRAQLEEHE